MYNIFGILATSVSLKESLTLKINNVKNKDKENTGNVSGLLLYAKTDEVLTPNQDYSLSGNKISVKSLDLGLNFDGIAQQLNSIAYDFINTIKVKA